MTVIYLTNLWKVIFYVDKPVCEEEEIKSLLVEKEKPEKLCLKYKDKFDVKITELNKQVN